jgi:hypothetical protein
MRHYQLETGVFLSPVPCERSALCPFLHRSESICTASLTSMCLPVERELSSCRTDDFEDCPFFLSYLLQRSREALPRWSAPVPGIPKRATLGAGTV